MISPETSSLFSGKSFPRRFVAGVLLLNLLVAGLVWYSLQKSKTLYQQQARISAHNISQVLDENISSTISKIDITLQSVLDEAERQLATGTIREEAFNRFIIRQHARLPELITFRATNAAGLAIYGAKAVPAKTASLAHRSYFARLRDDPKAAMVISKPLVGGISGTWMLVFARRINRPDGSFAGLVYAGLSLESLRKSFSELDIGSHGVISLLDSDLKLVTRHPKPAPDDRYIGQIVTMQQLGNLVTAGAASGTFTETSNVDSVERIFSFSRLQDDPHQPFYLLVGVAPRDYLAGWYLELYKMVLFLSFFISVSVLSVWLFRREWQKTGKAQQELSVLNAELEQRVVERTQTAENSNKTLNAIIACMSDWLWEVDAEGRYTYCSPQVESFLGYRADEMVGKTPLDFMEPQEAVRVAIIFGELVHNRLPIVNLENTALSKDGRRVLLLTGC